MIEKIISGSSPDVRIEKQYQSWIYSGLGDIFRDSLFMNMNNSSKNEIPVLNIIEVPRGKPNLI